jgi:NADPH:quinone reductase-like Zn-dependent oxidoreductase
MKAVVWTKYGPPDGLQLREVEKPSPTDSEVLIRVYATTVSAGDCEMRRLKFPLALRLPMRIYVGLKKPTRITILGQELSGEIAAIGRAVKQFKEGDKVFAALGFGMGAYAEYICLPENPEEVQGVLATKPTNMTFGKPPLFQLGDSMHCIFSGEEISSGDRRF